MYKKEKSGVVALSCFFGFFIVGCITLIAIFHILANTIFNQDFLKEAFTNKNAVNAFNKIANDALKETFKENYPEYDFETDLFTEDFSKELLEAISDKAFFDDFSKEELEKLYDDLNEQIATFIDENEDTIPTNFDIELFNSADDFIDSFENAFSNYDASFIDDLPNVKSGIKSVITFLIVVTCILLGILLLVHSKKYRVLKVLGICVLISGISLFALYLESKSLLKTALENYEDTTDMEQFITAIVEYAVKPLGSQCLMMIIIGIGLIILVHILDHNNKIKASIDGSQLFNANTTNTYSGPSYSFGSNETFDTNYYTNTDIYTNTEPDNHKTSQDFMSSFEVEKKNTDTTSHDDFTKNSDNNFSSLGSDFSDYTFTLGSDINLDHSFSDKDDTE